MSKADTQDIYAKAQLGGAVTLGERPAVLVVDFSCGFTDPGSRLGSNLDAEVAATKGLLDIARAKGLPVVFTTVAFDGSDKDGGLWPQKLPALSDLRLGSKAVEIDPRLERRADEPLVVKKGASAFFGTNLVAILCALKVDTVVLCGATTSGCIRATAIDLMQYGFPTIVPRECVGDRAATPHETNLFDIHAKYADVVAIDVAQSYLSEVRGG